MAPRGGSQLNLFGDPTVEPATVSPSLLEVAARLPATLRLGTSSWAFPGWKDLVYARTEGAPMLSRHGLAAYARHPLLRTVGLDRSYYAPVPVEELRDYACAIPADFRMVVKVWEEITLPVFPDHPRYGARAGQANPHFLDVSVFLEAFVRPFRDALWNHVAAMVLEFSPMRPATYGSPHQFSRRLGAFLAAVPPDIPLAVELRNAELLTPFHGDMLREHHASHVFNRWTRMPPIHVQRRVVGAPWTPQVVARVMLPANRTYEERKQECAPFHELRDVDEEMRADVTSLCVDAFRDGRGALVIINNKAEGCAPRTVFDLAARVTQALES
jgi:uncharacterized protein YecE (DUF72 family)